MLDHAPLNMRNVFMGWFRHKEFSNKIGKEDRREIFLDILQDGDLDADLLDELIAKLKITDVVLGPRSNK